MKTIIIGQIHDSIIADVYKGELKDYLHMSKKVMTEDIRKHWKWINVPLEIEAEVCDIDQSWNEKKKYKEVI
jgi:DNA polymerase I-like protein with 3'-5' exonuclease and polymerase domains